MQVLEFFANGSGQKDHFHSTKLMQIDFIITELNVGGAERALTRLAIGLRECGDDVRVFSIGPLPSSTDGRGQLIRILEQHQIPVSSASAGGRFAALAVGWKLRNWLAERPQAVRQSFLYHANVMTQTVAPWNRRRGPMIAGIRVAEQRPKRIWIERQSLRRADHVVCVSQAVRSFARSSLQISNERSSVIGNCVDVDAFASATPFSLSELKWPADADVVLFIGRLHSQKNLTLLQSHLDRFVPAGHPRRRLLIIGEGPLQNQIDDWIDRVSGDRVRRLPWQSDVAPFLTASRVLVLPSHYEGMPNVILEAMAAGKPVVCSQVEGSQELIEGDDRQSFPPGDGDAMVERLNRFLENAGLADQVGVANQTRMREQFSVHSMVAAYRELYCSLSGNRERGAI